MHISELSRATGVSLRSLRYYEEKELLHPVRLDNGYREYGLSDVERVRIIQLYFSLGLSAKEISDAYPCAGSEDVRRDCLPGAIRVGEAKLAEIGERIDTLRRAEAHLQECLTNWRRQLEEGGDHDE
ncbi:transcriptional regulator [Paenibacillus sp. XY044]|nr:transcriptional regulator [Paenibacillus sp. XY044]